MLCHDLLGVVFAAGCPSWNEIGEMDLGNADDAEEGRDVRAKIQKKAWRSRCDLREPAQRRKILLLCWLGGPVEDLMSQLQWLDWAKQGLMDVQIPDGTLNPFHTARRRICSILRTGRKGPVQPLFDSIPADEHPEFSSQARTMGLQFSAEIAWRFAIYGEYPYSFGHVVHPAVPVPNKLAKLDGFFARRDCCHGLEFALKVRKLYPWSEWLLALFRNVVGRHAVDIERFISTGLVGHLLKIHQELHRQDPRVTTRQQLLQMGVPLQARPGQPIIQHPGGPWVPYFNARDAQCKAEGRVMNRAAWEALRDECRLDFLNLSEAEMTRWVAVVRQGQDEREEEEEEEEEEDGDEDLTAVIKRSGRYTRTVVDAIGDELQPLPATVLERVARDVADKHGSVEPGLNAYAAKLRAEQRGKMYLPDRKDIPRDRSFDYYVPCSLAHPELCAQKEPHLVTACTQITKTAYQALNL